MLGNILRICPNITNLTLQVYARMCIELDVAKPRMESFLMGTSKEDNWPVYIEYEGNNVYCTHCGLLGYTMGLCRKKYRHLDTTSKTAEKNDKGGKNTNHKEAQAVPLEKSKITPAVTILKRGETNTPKVQEILKEVGFVDSETTSPKDTTNMVEDTHSGENSQDTPRKNNFEQSSTKKGIDNSVTLNSNDVQVADNMCKAEQDGVQPFLDQVNTAERFDEHHLVLQKMSHVDDAPSSGLETRLQQNYSQSKTVTFDVDEKQDNSCSNMPVTKEYHTTVAIKFRLLATEDDTDGIEILLEPKATHAEFLDLHSTWVFLNEVMAQISILMSGYFGKVSGA